MSAWSEYKKKLGDAKPWDILNPAIERATKEIEEARYSICEKCPELIEMTKQCRQCGCFMKIKAKIANATCPLNKW